MPLVLEYSLCKCKILNRVLIDIFNRSNQQKVKYMCQLQNTKSRKFRQKKVDKKLLSSTYANGKKIIDDGYKFVKYIAEEFKYKYC